MCATYPRIDILEEDKSNIMNRGRSETIVVEIGCTPYFMAHDTAGWEVRL